MTMMTRSIALPARRSEAQANFDGEWRLPLWKVWLAMSALLVVLSLPNIWAFRLNDPDDYMRLLQVRDWMGGQSWFDVRQYRMDPPAGADMHWTRLVDVPIAALIALFDLILPVAAAERAALTLVPLLGLLLAMVLLRQLLRESDASDSTVLAAIAMIPLFPLLPPNFGPMRIDHHAWQALAALTVSWLMLRGGWRAAFAAGGVASVWLNISLEGLPLVTIVGALFGVRYWLHARRDHEAFLLGLAFGGPVLFVLTRPAATLTVAYCDVPSWPHFLAFAAAAAVAAAARMMPAQSSALGRLASLAPVALVAATLVIAPLGSCALFPLAELDPILRQRWFENIAESAPLTSQSPSVVLMLLWTIGVTAAGAWLAWERRASPAAGERWLMLAGVALGAGVLSLWVMRVAVVAQLLALPFAAVVLTHLLPKARAVVKPFPRVAATLACFGLATPVFASSLLKPFGRTDTLVVAKPLTDDRWKRCDFARLNAIPGATLFAPLDEGPEILVKTNHTVIVGGYHRNQRRMREVVEGFSEPLDHARGIVAASPAGYVAACTGLPDIAVYARVGSDNLADRLIEGRPPGWLEPVHEFAQGRLKVWRIVR